MRHRLEFLRQKGFYPRTVLDIGAFRGEWTLMAQEVWPRTRFFMIEANGDCEKELIKIGGAQNYGIVLLGKANKPRVNFYVTDKTVATGNSVYRENSIYFSDKDKIQMPMITLDDFVSQTNLSNIDMIKIDAQGSELDILSGGHSVIKNCEFILLETQIIEYNLGAPKISRVFPFMERRGFELFDIVDFTYIPSGDLAQVDLIFSQVESKFAKRDNLL